MKAKKKPVKFTVDYFIKKFKAIPRYHWTCGAFQESKYEGRVVMACALGHCGVTGANNNEYTPEATALLNLMRDKLGAHVICVNDCDDSKEFTRSTGGMNPREAVCYVNKGKHPRTRVLNALKTIKERTS